MSNKEDSDEVLTLIDENKCWTCKCELEECSENCQEKYACPECEDVYYSCVECERKDGHPSSLDWEDNDKGMFCARCSHHFCIAHWQNGDFDFQKDGYDWMCNGCLAERKATKAERKVAKAERKATKLKGAIHKASGNKKKK